MIPAPPLAAWVTCISSLGLSGLCVKVSVIQIHSLHLAFANYRAFANDQWRLSQLQFSPGILMFSCLMEPAADAVPRDGKHIWSQTVSEIYINYCCHLLLQQPSKPRAEISTSLWTTYTTPTVIYQHIIYFFLLHWRNILKSKIVFP